MKAPLNKAYYRVLSLCFLAPTFMALFSTAQAIEIRWTGTASSSWSNAGNWDGGTPGKDDIARIPSGGNQPEVDATATICAGIILEQDATLTVLPNAALYVIGPGDLDGDGISDVAEREESLLPGNSFDADDNGIPNFDEVDSDGDRFPDAYEFQHKPCIQPYQIDDPDLDSDGDGCPNWEECLADTDPYDPNDKPMPLISTLALVALCSALAASSVLILRKTRPGIHKMLSVLLVAGLLALGGRIERPSALAAIHTVDFADSGQTLQAATRNASAEDTLEINGGGLRPWNGASTYVTHPVQVKAAGGTIFLGGMRTTVKVGVLGQGSVGVTSAYTSSHHPAPVSAHVVAGSLSVECFLGEHLELTPTADTRWGFAGWTDNTTGSTNLPKIQVAANGARITALFGPPETDLALSMPPLSSNTLKAGDSINAHILITNIGQSGTTATAWTDGLYLSRDAVFETADLALGTVAHSGALAKGDNYTTSFTIALPDVAPGRYYLLGVADAGGAVADVNRSNNAVAVELIVLDANLAR